MSKSINKTDPELEKFIKFIEETGDALKIVCSDVRENVEGALFDQQPLPDSCPSRASAAEFGMRRLKKYILEINTLTTQLETHIFKNYSDKK